MASHLQGENNQNQATAICWIQRVPDLQKERKKEDDEHAVKKTREKTRGKRERGEGRTSETRTETKKKNKKKRLKQGSLPLVTS